MDDKIFYKNIETVIYVITFFFGKYLAFYETVSTFTLEAVPTFWNGRGGGGGYAFFITPGLKGIAVTEGSNGVTPPKSSYII